MVWPINLLSGQNRLFKQLGYDKVAYLESAVPVSEQTEETAPARILQFLDSVRPV